MNGTPLAILLAACVAAGCAHSFQPKAVDKLHAGMVVGEVSETLGPPDFITSVLRPEGGTTEMWQYGVKGKLPSSYCVEFVNGRLLAWRRSDVPVGHGCASVPPAALQPQPGADVGP